MASFLPFRPSFRWTVGSSVFGGWEHVSISPIASPALRRHRSVSYPVRCQTLVSRRLPEPTRLAPRVSSSALQHFRIKEPFFSPFAERPNDFCPVVRKSPPQGLATLSGIFVPSSWGAFLSSQHSWASLFRAFLLSGDRKTLSGLSLRSCASLQTLDGFGSALQRLPPTGKAVPLSAPRRISSGRDLLLS